MSYANASRDILPGSTWIDATGEERVRVVAAAARFVVFRYMPGAAGPPPGGAMSEAEFRLRYFPIYNRAAVRSQFSMCIANLGEFRVFWLPAHRRIMARSVSCTRHFRVPDDASLVGTYSAPFRTEDFLADLDDIIRRLPIHAAARALESA